MAEGNNGGYEHKVGEKGQFYVYERMHRNDPEHFLSIDELIEQTDRFMQTFEADAEAGRLPGTVFFIDKSARPLAYLFRKLFPRYYPDQAVPQVRFINVGGGGQQFDSHAEPFDKDPQILRNRYGPWVKPQESILVVDEWTTGTSNTLNRTVEMLHTAFPDRQVSGTIAYSKLPNWYQNKLYLGVEEYQRDDYDAFAIRQLNEELGTTYGSARDIQGIEPGGSGYEHYEKYRRLRDGISGSIPHTKKGQHEHSYYEKKRPRIIDRLLHRSLPYEERTENLFLEARLELDRFADQIDSLRQRRQHA